jgi:hypothetical protein
MPEYNLVDALIAQNKRVGFLRNNRFAVIMKLNERVWTAVGQPQFADMNTRLSQFCKLVTPPKRGMNVINRKIVGPDRKIAVKNNYGDETAITFHFPADAKEWILFEKWQELIVDPITRRVGYYEDYSMGCKMLILMLPNYVKNYNQVMEAADQKQLPGLYLNEIYPSSVELNGSTLDTGSTNELATMTVTFAYRDVYTASFDEMVRHGYVSLDEREFNTAGKLLDPNAYLPPVESRESTKARMDALAQNGFVITPGVNDQALERNRAYLDLTPKPQNRNLSINQIINLAALL